jgi:TolB protein
MLSRIQMQTKSYIVSFTPLLIACLFGGLSSYAALSSENRYISVGTAQTKKAVIAFPEVRSNDVMTGLLGKSISDIVQKDLQFMSLFNFLSPSSFIENPTQAGILPETFKLNEWAAIGTEFLLKTSLVKGPEQTLAFETHVYDVAAAKQIFSKRYIAPVSDLKNLAHNFANDVMQNLTGMPGIFLTKIAMSCDKSGKKEIYMMNYDGTDVKQVTHHRSIAFGPAWSPDGTRLAYSLITRHSDNNKNIDLYEFNFANNTVRLLSDKIGINSGAAYAPDGKKIALTLSYLGNPEIFILDTTTRKITRVTRSYGFDVDPSWSPDGESLTFVSSRTGRPMVFSSKADGTKIQRLTFAGRYNATPTWSPRNNKIGFAGWIDKSFDIFIMNPDGTTIERLTKNQGNNEDPFFSPDGNFILFSSNRTGQKNIYLMNVDGTFVKRLTYGLGNCVAPKWSTPVVSKPESVKK